MKISIDLNGAEVSLVSHLLNMYLQRTDLPLKVQYTRAARLRKRIQSKRTLHKILKGKP